MVRHGPDPRRVIDLRHISPEDAEELDRALEDDRRRDEEPECQTDGKEVRSDD
jgi:hypothetical protein